MKRISEYDFKGRKALIRVDFNVPLNSEMQITDDTRIRAAVPTIKRIIDNGGAVILMSHLGRPKGRSQELSLAHIRARVEELTGARVIFCNDCIGADAQTMAQNLQPGEVLLLENLRFYQEEEKGDEGFARKLAALGDVYVNDAFGTAHRAHASTAVIAGCFPEDRMFGFLMEKEVDSIDRVLRNGEKPVTAIIGGAKVSSKISIIRNMLDKVDHLIIGGGMAFTFVKANDGAVGSSLVEEDKLDLARELMKEAREKGVQLHIPTDTVIADAFSNDAKTDVCQIKTIPDGWMGLDIGPETIKTFAEVIRSSKTILWNGPMGVFELPKFSAGTLAVAKSLAEATEAGAFTLIGGGDSVAAINQFNMAHKVSFVSTGGGAMLESLEGITLPGIAAIQN